MSRTRSIPVPDFDVWWEVMAERRAALFQAWGAWLDTEPKPEWVDDEITGTASVMRQMRALRKPGPP
jgi:hypothetical protein